ncbi:hypothetical protein Ahy_A07g032518 [Arachis hypogaea]|uniref:NADH-ubiquinone oxidoreductase chain 4 n=1 Tax=Arachis hypogaea TaxID=3818 RepID=A0A445C726_ARAHY|nr:hypothetical protein Ahy_A07g032518 [Arachis hypogaea]
MGAVERFHIAEPKGSTPVRDRSMTRHLVPTVLKSTYALSPEVTILYGWGVIGVLQSVGERKSLALSNIQGIGGSIPPMLSHGLVPSAFFLCVGVLYDRRKTRLVRYYRSLMSTVPNLSTIFFSSILANMSSPGTSNFIREFFISVGAFQRNSLVATLATLGMILGAV